MYVDACVNTDPEAKLRATAVSPKTGKTLYFYSKRHVEGAAREKWKRVQYLMRSIDRIAEKVGREARKGRAEALVLRLILQTGMRNGNPPQGALATSKESFGASSLRFKHAAVEGDHIVLDFPGKKGVAQHYELQDALLAAWIRGGQLQGGRPDDLLFPTTAHAVLRYLRKVDKRVKVHDLRTWLGCALATALLEQMKDSGLTQKRLAKAVATIVASKLGNTPGVALKSYIDPALWENGEE
jgi:DNA topoisomerase I